MGRIKLLRNKKLVAVRACGTVPPQNNACLRGVVLARVVKLGALPACCEITCCR